MEFINSQISLENLPKTEEAHLTSIDPRYFRVLVYQKLILWGVVMIGIAMGILFYEKLHSTLLILLIVAVLASIIFADFRISYLS